MRTGGQIVVDHLLAEGVRHVFMVPGESFLGLLTALHAEQRLRPVTARHESAAAMMAEATGKLTGRPGVAVVTRGPGAANALAGVYIASQDQSPMVLLVGLPPRTRSGAPAFQQIDLGRVFGSIAKSVTIAENSDSLSQLLAHAFHMAVSGRPGPVVLGLPEDVLHERAQTAQPPLAAPRDRKPSAQDVDQLEKLLDAAECPLIIAGSATWSAEAAAALAAFAGTFDIPVATSFRRQDRFDNSHDCYAGHLGFAPHAGLVEAVRRADLVIALGACLDDVTTRGYTLIKPRSALQKLVVISPDAHTAEACRPHKPDLVIAASPIEIGLALGDLRPPETNRWRDWRRTLRAEYEISLGGGLGSGFVSAGLVPLDQVAAHLARRLPAGAIVCNGAGQYAATLQRQYVYRAYPSQLAPLSGSMGYGLPAAIAAKLAYPDRIIVAIAGDGCFQMTGAELATAVQLELPLIIIIANNNKLGSIETAQLKSNPPRVIATTLVNPDFARLAQATGAAGFCADNIGDFAAALEQALTSRGPAVIEIAVA
ncbi:MAG: thiamine pyrophosphate-binding protein [Hyphomicrobium sp.]|nr:thiamine pyrophosphate-binding protein [Hyphomicrobium sp.]